MTSINSIFNAFRDTIDGKFLPQQGGAYVELEESQEQASCRSVTLNTKKVSNKPLVVNLDVREPDPTEVKKLASRSRREAKRAPKVELPKTHTIDLHPLLKKESGFKIGCDYLLVCPFDGKIYLLLVELKSKQSENWIAKCIASECLTTYLISTINRVQELNIEHELVFRYVLFKITKDGRKRLTGTRQTVYDYDEKRKIHYTIWSCNDDGDGHDLRLFLR